MVNQVHFFCLESEELIEHTFTKEKKRKGSLNSSKWNSIWSENAAFMKIIIRDPWLMLNCSNVTLDWFDWTESALIKTDLHDHMAAQMKYVLLADWQHET